MKINIVNCPYFIFFFSFFFFSKTVSSRAFPEPKILLLEGESVVSFAEETGFVLGRSFKRGRRDEDEVVAGDDPVDGVLLLLGVASLFAVIVGGVLSCLLPPEENRSESPLLRLPLLHPLP